VRRVAISACFLGFATRAPCVRAESPEELYGERYANNAVYAEGLGPGIVYSLNYDRAFGDWAIRAGVGLVPGQESGKNGPHSEIALGTVPITVTFIGAGNRWSMLEVGLGVVGLHVAPNVSTFLVDRKTFTVNTVLGTGIVGYRFQPPRGGVIVRLGVCPVVSRYGFFPLWPYGAFGGTF